MIAACVLPGTGCVTLRLCSREGLCESSCAAAKVLVCVFVWRHVMCLRMCTFASRVFCGLLVDNYRRQLAAIGAKGRAE